MSNFSTAVDATATAMNSAGSAAQENSAYMESLNAKTQQLKATFEDFSNNVIESDLVKSILDLANNALSALNTETGATITQWTLLTGVLTGGVTIFGQIAGKLVSGVAHIGTTFKTLAGVFTGATTGIGAFASAALPVAGIIAGIAVAGYGIYKYYKQANPTLEEATEKLNSLQSELDTNVDRLKEINDIPWYDRTPEIENERKELERLNEALRENISIATEEQLEAARKKVEENRLAPSDTLQQVTVYKYGQEIISPVGEYIKDTEKFIQDFYVSLGIHDGVIDASISTTEQMAQKIKELGYSFEFSTAQIETSAEESNKYYTKTLNTLSSQLQKLESAGASEKEIASVYSEYQSLLSVIKPLISAYTLLQDNGEILSQDALDLISAYDSVGESMTNLIEQAKETDRVQTVLQQGIQITSKELAGLIKENSSLAKYVAQTNDNIYIQKDALLDAASSSDSYAAKVLTNLLKVKKEAYLTAVQVYELNKQLAISRGTELSASVAANLSNNIREARQEYNYLAQQMGYLFEEPLEIDIEPDTTGTSQIEDILDPLKEHLEKEEHKIFLLDKQDQEANAQEIINIYKNAQKVISQYADNLRAKGYAEDSEQIRELQELWWGYQDEIDSVYDAIEDRAEEARQKIEEETQKQIDALTKETNVYEQLFSYMTDQIDKEIEALEKQRDAEEQLWDNKINALQEQNDEIERQIELEQLQDQLARAKQSRVLVYKDGRFQYVEDIDEVSEAQKNLEDYEREEALRQETENLEKLKEEALAAIDEQIEGWEKYKEQWSSVVEDYQEEQNRLMIEQELGIKLEGEHWKERLDNLQDFIDDYKKLMDELLKLEEELYEEDTSSIPSGSISSGTNAGIAIGGVIGGAGGSLIGGAIGGILGNITGSVLDKINSSNNSYSGTSTSGGGSYTIGSDKGKDFVDSAPVGSTMTGGDGSKWTKNPDGSTTISKGGNTWTVSGYASGTLSAPGGLSLVGENGPELRWINPGDGILPANITKNLWGWGSMSPNEFMSKLSGTSVVIQNLNLPNVRDPQDFTNYLKNNFWRKTVQFQTK